MTEFWQVDYDWSPFVCSACVHPGETHLGSTSDIGTWYAGTCCYG
ncbi:hypothetical protein OG381_00730 [Streptomyces sp. NBC_00490]